MHTLMTDLVESQGGSSVLVKTLNRLGVCSSADTLARFIQHKRSTSEQHQFRHMSKDAFTVVSADNLDFMHSFARVFCGNQRSSWHGTTVQVAQPLPSLSLPESYEGAVRPFVMSQGYPTHRDCTSMITQGTDPHISLTGAPCGGHGDTSVSLPGTRRGGHGDTSVSLTGTPCGGHGDTFVSLTGAPCGGHGDTSVSLTGDTSVSLTGDTSVSLTGAPRGGHGDTSVSLTGDTSVSLTGAPRGGHGDTFVSLTGAPCGGHGDTSVSLTGDTSVSLTGDTSVSLTGAPRGGHGDTFVSLTGAPRGGHGDTFVSLTGAPCGGHRDTSDYTDGQLISASRKRLERSSPFPSPMKLTRSPLAKMPRRLRTGRTLQDIPPAHLPEPTYRHTCHSNDLTLSDFVCNSKETQSQLDLQSEMSVYIIHRVALCNSSCKHPFLGLQDYYALTRCTHTEESYVMYLDVLDAVADCKDTMMGLLHSLRKMFVEDRNMRWLVLEGDAKLYEILKSLSFEYGEELNWLIPYPGDFHMLMNFQKAMMKPYYDAGLKALAQAAGYPLPAIQTCSQFKRTHHFILEAWEAIYRVMLLKYEEANSSMNLLTGITTEILSMSTDNFPSAFNHYLDSKSTTFQQLPCIYSEDGPYR